MLIFFMYPFLLIIINNELHITKPIDLSPEALLREERGEGKGMFSFSYPFYVWCFYLFIHS